MPPNPTAALDYAPPPPKRNRRRIEAIVLGAGLGVAIFVFINTPFYEHILGRYQLWKTERAQIAYWAKVRDQALPLQALCMQHVNDPGKIAFRTAQGTRHNVTEWKQFRAVAGSDFAYFNRGGLADIFVHDRRNSRGESRLVVVEARALNNHKYTVSADAFVPGTPEIHPSWFVMGGTLLGTQISISSSTDLYEGEPDPSDPSHFTIRMTHDTANSGADTSAPKRDRIIDGWLDDYDTVRLKVRN